MLYGWLLDKNGYRCESLTDLSYPIVLLQGREGGSDRFIERLRGDLYGVLNVPNILYRNCARSESHMLERSRFAFCSLLDQSVTNRLQARQESGFHYETVPLRIRFGLIFALKIQLQLQLVLEFHA